MKKSKSSAACPDWVVLALAPGAVDFFGLAVAWAGATVLWHERLPLDHPESLPERLRQLPARRPLAPMTPVSVVVPPEIGGFLLLPAPSAGVVRDPAWLANAVRRSLPYSGDELISRVLHREGRAEIFWVPADWARNLGLQLAECGLGLRELLPRSALFRGQARPANAGAAVDILLEQGENAAYLHLIENGLVRRAARVDGDDAALQAAVALERAAAESAGTPAALRQADLPSSAMAAGMLGVWGDVREAIDCGRTARAEWSPLVKAALALGAFALAGIAGLAWQTAAIDEALREANATHKTLAAVRLRATAADAELAKKRAVLDAVARADAAPYPLATFNAIASALPGDAWLHKMQFRDGAIEIQGIGIEGKALVEQMAELGLKARASDVEAAGAKPPKPPFRVSVDLLPPVGGKALP